MIAVYIAVLLGLAYGVTYLIGKLIAKECNLMFAWFDGWIGYFWDRGQKKLYIIFIPTIAIVMKFRLGFNREVITRVVIAQTQKHGEGYIRDKGLDPRRWRVITRESQLRGLYIEQYQIQAISNELERLLRETFKSLDSHTALNRYIGTYCSKKKY